MLFPHCRSKWLMRNLFLLTAMAASANLAFGQFTSSIEGTVMDASQSAVPGARVVLTNELTQVTQQANSSDAGFFRISDLPPGTYRVQVNRDGFKTWLQTNLRSEERRVGKECRS